MIRGRGDIDGSALLAHEDVLVGYVEAVCRLHVVTISLPPMTGIRVAVRKAARTKSAAMVSSWLARRTDVLAAVMVV